MKVRQLFFCCPKGIWRCSILQHFLHSPGQGTASSRKDILARSRVISGRAVPALDSPGSRAHITVTGTFLRKL